MSEFYQSSLKVGESAIVKITRLNESTFEQYQPSEYSQELITKGDNLPIGLWRDLADWADDAEVSLWRSAHLEKIIKKHWFKPVNGE